MNNPKIWGPSAWIFLHTITFNYPNYPTYQDKINYKTFFKNLKHILPCNTCKINYLKHYDNNPLTDIILSNKDHLIDWLINIHNDVNIINDKNVVTRKEVLNLYQNLYNNKKHDNQYDNQYDNKYGHDYKKIVLVVVFIAFFVVVIKKLF
jgi:hypothetical protein